MSTYNISTHFSTTQDSHMAQADLWSSIYYIELIICLIQIDNN